MNKLLARLCKRRIERVPWYLRGNADFGGGIVVYDKDVAKYVSSHMRFADKLNIGKIVVASMWAFDILCGALSETEVLEKGKFVFPTARPQIKR